MEEKKCCEGGHCCCCGCCAWMKKHPEVKKLIVVILIILAFWLGAALGNRHGYQERYEGRNFKYSELGPKGNLPKGWQDEVTVKVQPEVPVTPPVAQ
jgi:hypothetical protein